MSGKPAARQGDMTQYGGPVVQGAAGVMIGAPTGVACSVCPGGRTSGNPVNPLLGAKVLPGETDFALPGPLPFMLSRSYNSWQTRTPAPVGIFGPGWKAPFDIRLQLRDDELIINDDGGRSIHFEPLLPGETAFSRSESLWLARGGVAKLHESNVLHVLWQALPEDLRLSPHLYLATSSAQGPWWILGWSARVPGAEEPLPAPLPPYRVLTGLADRFGRTQIFHRDADGESAGNITAVTDGAGRRFRLRLTTQAQRAEAARKQATVSGISAPEYPQTMPVSGYGADSGIRLEAVWLTHDPAYPDNLPALPLARYTYTPRGELSAVYDRSDTPVRSFTYDDKHPGRMTAHQYAGRPQTAYRYDASGRVTEQHNPAGLSYRYEYEKNVITVTDSLNRREVLHTEGEGGLKRVIKEEKAGGSTITREFDNAGRLVAQTDAAGRKTEFRLNIGSGNVTEIVTPDGRSVRFSYNDQRQLISTTGTDGLRSQQAFDALGRLTQEKSRHGDITRYFYDDPDNELPSAIEDATGSRKQMTWSRYGQLLTLTDCSGYRTRYEYNRFGQATALHQEEGLSQYRAYDERGRLVSQKDAAGHKTRYEYSMAGDLTTVVYLAGVKPGNTPLVDFTRDRLHRETQRTSGAYEQNTLYGATGQLLSHTFSDPVLNRDTVITTTVSLCASVACIRRKTTAMTARGGSSAHATTTCCGATPPTRRATVLQTGNSTRRFPRCGGITASAKTCSIFTTTTRTEGWRKRMNAESAMAAATATIITTITSTVCATIAANNRVSRFWKAATCMTRWAAASENGCGKADVSAEASAERNIFT